MDPTPLAVTRRGAARPVGGLEGQRKGCQTSLSGPSVQIGATLRNRPHLFPSASPSGPTLTGLFPLTCQVVRAEPPRCFALSPPSCGRIAQSSIPTNNLPPNLSGSVIGNYLGDVRPGETSPPGAPSYSSVRFGRLSAQPDVTPGCLTPRRRPLGAADCPLALGRDVRSSGVSLQRFA